MKKVLAVLLLFIVTVFFVRFIVGGGEDTWLCNTEKGEWIKHGNPTLGKPDKPCGESRDINNQERIEKSVFCESDISSKNVSASQAKIIAERDCKDGTLKDIYYCNDYTGTWWFDFEPKEPKEGCNPACVVNVENETAEINWRCTGYIPE